MVAQSFMYPASVVKELDVFDAALAGRFAGWIESQVYYLLLEDGEDTLTPCFVSWSDDIRETLLPTIIIYLFFMSSAMYWLLL